jgi:hypothetical protein
VDYFNDADQSPGNAGICNFDVAIASGDHVWRSHFVTDFFHGTVAAIAASYADVTFTTAHDDPWVYDPVGMNTCAQLNTF